MIVLKNIKENHYNLFIEILKIYSDFLKSSVNVFGEITNRNKSILLTYFFKLKVSKKEVAENLKLDKNAADIFINAVLFYLQYPAKEDKYYSFLERIVICTLKQMNKK